jgi:hypothetical protein
MKKEKMSIDKMKNVLSHVLSREEMKEVMAGSGSSGAYCGACYTSDGTGSGGTNQHSCYSGTNGCVCSAPSGYHSCS